jgi:acyl-CoA synthetase (AMP-forming)/AMP-acid ligase II
VGAACRPGTVGWPIAGVQARLVDERGAPLSDGEVDAIGELEVRGPTVMLGYYEPARPSAAAVAGDASSPASPLRAASDGGPPWLPTGDMARRDREGMFTIVGRMSTDILKSGGFKIGALEIEACLAAHPAVAEVAVVGLPDPTWGERVAAAVVLRPNATVAGPTLAAELQSWCRARLADFKTPRELQFLAELPRNAMGKIQKRALLAAWPPPEGI